MDGRIVERKYGFNIKSQLLKLFLEKHGWHVVNAKTLAARITLEYAECVRSKRGVSGK